jgi:hypothetical protein
MAERTRSQDYEPLSVTDAAIQNETITIEKLVTQTAADAITAMTLPYVNTTPVVTPGDSNSIYGKINGISVSSITYFKDEFTGNASQTDFTLLFSRSIDTTSWSMVIVNGQVQNDSIDYTFSTATNLHFNYVIENGLQIIVLYKKL